MEKVGDVIGPSGKIIKSLILRYSVDIDIEDATGMAYIYGKDAQKVMEARVKIEKLIVGYNPGDTIEGLVFRIEDYGAFVKILDDGEESGKEGLIHISNFGQKRIETVEEVVNLGQKIKCQIVDVNEKGQIDLGFLGYLEEK